MRKITLLFAVLLSLVGVTQVKADAVTENFDDGNLPDGWQIVNTVQSQSYYAISVMNGRSRSGDYSLGSTTNNTTANNYVIVPEVTGTVSIYARAYQNNTTGNLAVYKYNGGLGAQIGTTQSRKSSSYTEYTFEVGSEPTQIAIAFGALNLDDITVTYATISGPALTVKDGATKVTSPYDYNFGLATAGTTHTFTLSNPGTEAVEGLSVAKTGDFGATLSATTIAAGGEATLTITMPEATGNSAITISSTTEGIADFVINASGTVRNPNKVYLDFSDGQIPDGWTSVAIGSYASEYGSAWAASEGYVSQSGSSSSYEWAFTSPKLTFSEGETIFFETQKYSSSTWYNPSIKVDYSTDGTSWTTIGSAYTDDTADAWTARSVNIPTADAKYIRFSGWYVKLRNIYGGELPNEPKMVVTEPATLDFGLYDKDASAPTKSFTIANTGKATLNGISVSSANAAFTITGAPTSLAAGADAEVTIAMSTASAGALSSLITVSATDMENATFTVTGVVMPAGMPVEEFTDGLPANWTNASWTFADGEATGKSSTAYLTTPKLICTASDFLVIKAKAADAYSGNYLTVQTSTDNGESFTELKKIEFPANSNTEYATYVVDGLTASVNKIRFVGYYAVVDEIYGLNYDQNAPVMEVSLGGSAIATGYADNFGTKVKAQPAAHTYTITNTGTGTLTGTITSSVPGHFTVSESAFSLAKDASLDFDLNLVFNTTYEDKASVITIHPTSGGLEDIVINASATTKDPEIWEEDFESGIPASWINENSAWTTTRYSHEGQAGPGSNSTSALITPRLQATEAQTLQFDVIGAESETYFLKAEYSTNRTDWTTIENYTTEGTKSFVAPADGYYWLRFTGNYTYVDNFYGFKEAPLAHDANITASSVPTTGNQYVEYTATVTVQEKAGKAETGVVATLYVNGVAVATDTQDLTANGSTVFTMSYTPNAATDGSVKAYVQVAYEDVELATDQIDLTIAAAKVYDEDEAPTVTEGTIASLVLKYTAKNGWGTICVPFALSSDIMTSIFGEGWKAYEFKGFNEGALEFQNTTTFYAGYPYIVHVTTAAAHAEGVKLQNVNISRTTAQYDAYSGAYFRGTYAPIAAGGWKKNAETDVIYGVSNAGKIAPAKSTTTMKGFRAYFDLPQGTEARLAIYDDATGITTVLDAKELNTNGKVYNLNGQQVQSSMFNAQSSKLNKGVYIVNGRKVVVK